MTRPPVSLVIITLNEEENIERCIKSVPWADEVVVLDSGSSDRTGEIAISLGAKLIVEPFRGFKKQKERVTELAAHDWVVSLDADEGLSPELSQEIQGILEKGEPPFSGYDIPRLSFHMGRWIRHGGWYPDRQLRFFHRGKCRWVGGHVHEKVTGENVGRLKSPIFHWVFKDLTDQVGTNNEYSSKGALDQFERKKKFLLIKLMGKPISKFLELYVWKRGFLDGVPGFVIAVGGAYSVFLKFAKLWELEKGLFRR